MVVGHADRSPLTEVTQGKVIEVHLDHKLPYQLDGGDRKPAKALEVSIEPGALVLCVPPPSS
jgi:diacylglycerol kinase family enzyme